MIVTVLWEDQRDGKLKGFAPGELATACVCDRRGMPPWARLDWLRHSPLKGNGNVMRQLQHAHAWLSRLGPVIAVVDRDQIHGYWQANPPTNCMTGILDRIASECRGRRDLVFLIDNMETLVAACCEALTVPRPSKKPNPAERDRIIAKIAMGDRRLRDDVQHRCPSFARLVTLIDAALPK